MFTKLKSLPGVSKLTLILAGLCLAVFGGFYFPRERKPAGDPPKKVRDKKTEVRVKFAEQIKKDPELAYANFKKDNSSAPSPHLYSHIFGEELYYALEDKGIGVCDSAFEFGCYHGFFSAGLSNLGNEDLVLKFNEGCRARWGDKLMPCQHGIGHGLLASGLVLREALKLCDKISQQPTGGCYSGVFMEYNFPTLSDHSGTAPRLLEGEEYYSPCETVAPELRDGCFFELPQFWLAIYGNDFYKIGALCDKIKASSNRQWCFLGSGNFIAPLLDFDRGRTASLCDSFSFTDGKNWCREGAAWIFLSRPNSSADALKLCEGMPECQKRVKQNPFYEEF